MGTKLHVDPGFVHHRKIESIIGSSNSELITKMIGGIPATTPEWRKEVLIDQIYSRVILDVLRLSGIKTLEQILAEQTGQMFCSIVRLQPCPDINEKDRVSVGCAHACRKSLNVEIQFTTARVRSDTLRSCLNQGGEFVVVAQLAGKANSTLTFHPLLIGFPYLNDTETGDLIWSLYTDHYHLHLENFREFSKVSEEPLPETFDEMRLVSETVFKRCLGKILSESTPKDWGGESSDFFTSHLHIGERRVSAAFLLKGPAKFAPMTLSRLGKNSDQIVRLAKEPAEVLIVQHCHDILPSVAETLKVFATQPYNPRQYCLVDGRESLRLLKKYGLLEWAIDETESLRVQPLPSAGDLAHKATQGV